MQNNIFLGGSDPLLAATQNFSPRNYDNEIERMSQMQQMLEQKKLEMENARAQMSSGQLIKSQTPIWDEIDKIVSDMSDRELDFMNGNKEFIESNQIVMQILQREQLRLMRPIVEQSQDGKQALENHLALVKRLKKEAANESDKAMELFKEYTENYPDMPYADFLKMKRNKQ